MTLSLYGRFKTSFIPVYLSIIGASEVKFKCYTGGFSNYVEEMKIS